MNTGEIVAEAAYLAKVSKPRARAVLDALVRSITAALERQEDVSISGFGKFRPHHRAGRPGRNPKTGEPADVPASTTVKFKPSERVRLAVNRTGPK